MWVFWAGGRTFCAHGRPFSVSEMHDLNGGEMNTEKIADSFCSILASVAYANASALAARARTANRLAKSVHGKSRRSAYALKHKALVALVEKFPGWSVVRRDHLQ